MPARNPLFDDVNSDTSLAKRSVDSFRRTKDDASRDVMSGGASPGTAAEGGG